MRLTKIIGAVVIIGIVIFMAILFQQSTVVASTVEKSFTEIQKTFEDGTQILIYETPDFLTPEQEEALAKYAQESFYSDILPTDFIRVTVQQYADKLLNDGTDPSLFHDKLADYANSLETTGYSQQEIDEIVEDVETQMIVQSGNTTSYSVDYEQTYEQQVPVLQALQNTENVYKRGEIVQIPIKITKDSPPPYVYNLNITCCEMSSFRASTAIETDGQGNDLIRIATNLKFPLGEWTVTVSTLSEDNRKIYEHEFIFTLVD